MTSLKPIIYFTLFKYPLSKEEIHNFSKTTSMNDLEDELAFLEKKKIIFNNQGFYSCIDDNSFLKRRLKGNEKAKNIMPKAFKRGEFISKFPYIKSVAISGALSKNYFDEEGDFDFFIITKKNRLWIARTILVLYKIVFLLNSHKFFCVNYFISEDCLKLEEKNRFTATEIATLIPITGIELFKEFQKENYWFTDFFPNLKLQDLPLATNKKNKNKLSSLVEYFFNSKIGDFLEYEFMKINLKRWRKKHAHLSKEEFEKAFKVNDKVSKSHPNNFQKKVLLLLNEKYAEIEKTHNIKLTLEHA